MNYIIRDATSADISTILQIMPRLAEFDLPARRSAEVFWSEDAKLLKRWGAGDAPNCFVHVADANGVVVGVTIVTLGEEFFDHSPSAHLEVVCVAKSADGHGLGRVLIDNAETEARKRGAGSMSLHVVANNKRARHVYERIGYTEELVRCIKHFD
ncbi:MAG: GNAT family N-acetyltransferase [Candidatus Promineifilaceae bacterium]